MSTLASDLHDILVKLHDNIPSTNELAGSALEKAVHRLGEENTTEFFSVLISNLSHLKQQIQSDYLLSAQHKEMFLKKLSNIERAFDPTKCTAQAGGFKKQIFRIDDIENLILIDSTLHSHGYGVKPVKAKSIEERITKIRDTIMDDDISPHLKIVFLSSIELIEKSLRHIELFGTAGIYDAVMKAIQEISIHAEELNENDKSESVKDIKSFFGDLANTVRQGASGVRTIEAYGITAPALWSVAQGMLPPQ